MSSCANCAKGEENGISLKRCGACMSVKYSDTCQKAHRLQHKNECELRAAELHEEALFKQPPKREDCPICFLRLPYLATGRVYMSCCGKMVCSGCIHAVKGMNSVAKCPFCRTPPATSDEEVMEREQSRIEVGDPVAMYNLGYYYDEGIRGLPQDHEKALELYHRAAELSHAGSYYNIGYMYYHGEGVESDKRKAYDYYEEAAMRGDEFARHNLGVSEQHAGNIDRALKHYMIAVEFGYPGSLKTIKQMYTHSYAAKDEYARALRAYQAYLDEIRSVQRDEAAAYSEDYKYYEL